MIPRRPDMKALRPPVSDRLVRKNLCRTGTLPIFNQGLTGERPSVRLTAVGVRRAFLMERGTGFSASPGRS